MPNMLKNVKLTEVSLVDRPANPLARVSLFKAESGGNLPQSTERESDMDEVKELQTKVGKLEGELAALKKANDESSAKVVEITAARDALQKKCDEQAEVIAKAAEKDDPWKGVPEAVRKRVEDAENVAKSERDARQLTEAIAKAEKEISHLPGELVRKGALLKTIGEKLSKEDAEELMRLLKAGDAAIAAGVTREIGTTSAGGDAWGKIQKAAEAIAKAENLTMAVATVKAIERNPELREAYRRENPVIPVA